MRDADCSLVNIEPMQRLQTSHAPECIGSLPFFSLAGDSMLCDMRFLACPHQFVSTKEAPVVRGPGQLWPCVALYNLASLNHLIHSAFSSSSSKPRSCSWLALQQKVLSPKWDAAAKGDTSVHYIHAFPWGQVRAALWKA